MDSRVFAALSRTLDGRATRRTALAGLGGCGLAAGLLSTIGGRAVAAAPEMAQDAALAWRLTGDVMEACQCNVTCPCNFASDPSYGTCGSMIGWHIEDGQYDETDLADLNFVAYLYIPGNAFAGGWTLGFYFDDRATAEQFEALTTIFSGQAGGWPAVLVPLIAKPIAPKQVPITFALDGENVRVTVPDLLEVGTERVPNPLPGMPPLDLKIANLAVPFYTGEADVRRSTIVKLTDPNLSYEYAGRSALIGRFEYTGP
jgi:hypothetical protein